MSVNRLSESSFEFGLKKKLFQLIFYAEISQEQLVEEFIEMFYL